MALNRTGMSWTLGASGIRETFCYSNVSDSSFAAVIATYSAATCSQCWSGPVVPWTGSSPYAIPRRTIWRTVGLFGNDIPGNVAAFCWPAYDPAILDPTLFFVVPTFVPAIIAAILAHGATAAGNAVNAVTAGWNTGITAYKDVSAYEGGIYRFTSMWSDRQGRERPVSHWQVDDSLDIANQIQQKSEGQITTYHVGINIPFPGTSMWGSTYFPLEYGLRLRFLCDDGSEASLLLPVPDPSCVTYDGKRANSTALAGLIEACQTFLLSPSEGLATTFLGGRMETEHNRALSDCLDGAF